MPIRHRHAPFWQDFKQAVHIWTVTELGGGLATVGAMRMAELASAAHKSMKGAEGLTDTQGLLGELEAGFALLSVHLMERHGASD